MHVSEEAGLDHKPKYITEAKRIFFLKKGWTAGVKEMWEEDEKEHML